MSDEQPDTTKISQSEIQLGLLNKLVGTVNDIKSEMQGVRADMGLVANDLGIVKDRVALLEKRADDSDKRADASSIRVKGQSQVDLETQAQLAQERMAREALAAKVEGIDAKTDAQTKILEGLKKVADKPAVKLAFHALLTAFISWLAIRYGIHVQLPGAP